MHTPVPRMKVVTDDDQSFVMWIGTLLYTTTDHHPPQLTINWCNKLGWKRLLFANVFYNYVYTIWNGYQSMFSAIPHTKIIIIDCISESCSLV